ncbi:MAG: hypothetical protein QXO71_05570, partial [Candidatus Jordarchaeaceae archaeon]
MIGFEPVGFTINATQFFSPNISYSIVLSHKNLYPIALAAISFGIGSNILFALFYKEKSEQIYRTAQINEQFKILKTIRKNNIFTSLTNVFVIFWFNVTYFHSFEFPYVFQIFKSTALPSLVLGTYLLLLAIPSFIDWKTNKRCIQILANTILPILNMEFTNRNPLIRISDLQNELGLQSANRQHFRGVLIQATKMSKQNENIHFGLSGTYVYLKGPLTKLVEENVKKKGKISIIETAKEMSAPPERLKIILSKLKREKLLENIRLRGKEIIPKSTHQ